MAAKETYRDRQENELEVLKVRNCALNFVRKREHIFTILSFILTDIAEHI